MKVSQLPTDSELVFYNYIAKNPDQTGYQITQNVSIPKATVQSLLTRLLHKKLVKVRKDPKRRPGRPRKLYRLTARGRAIHRALKIIQSVK